MDPAFPVIALLGVTLAVPPPVFTPAPPATPPATDQAPALQPAPAAPAIATPGSAAAAPIPAPAPGTPAPMVATPAPPPPPPPPAPPYAGAELPIAPEPLPVPPPPLLRQRHYGDAGSTELSLALGYTKQTGFFGGGGFRRFLADGIGPGIEGSVQKAEGQPTTGLLLASLKLVPVRGEVAALILTGRGGRVFLSDHDDGWGFGGAAGAIFFLSPGVGLEVGYAILWLLPRHFCADLVSCRIEGPELGLRVSF